jgi:hypothetical protein
MWQSWERKNIYRILVGEDEGNRQLGDLGLYERIITK